MSSLRGSLQIGEFGEPDTGYDSIRIILCEPDKPYPLHIDPVPPYLRHFWLLDEAKVEDYVFYDTWIDGLYGSPGDFPDNDPYPWAVRTKLVGGNLEIYPPVQP